MTERQAADENARGPDLAVGLGISANKPVLIFPRINAPQTTHHASQDRQGTVLKELLK